MSLLKFLRFITLILGFCSPGFAKDSKLKITWGGYIDTHYAFDFNSPSSIDRPFSSQPARSNEFNLNLGHIDVNINSENLRGRFALQTGTSVQSIYSTEPIIGSISGPDSSRQIQEARLGYKISEKTWIDAGIFFSHVGAESWISKDNISLTRSLVIDNLPYYLSGVKITHKSNDNLTLQLLITNGWQNISENNTDKNIGTGVEYSLKNISFFYNTMFGNEVSANLNGNPRAGQFRHFHNFMVRSKNTGLFEWIAEFDIGFQQDDLKDNFSQWYGFVMQSRFKISESQKIFLRLEHFQDPDQIVLVTNRPDSFNVFGGSIGFDQQLENNLFWRTEIRYLQADSEIFPKNNSDFSKNNITTTTSLSFSF